MTNEERNALAALKRLAVKKGVTVTLDRAYGFNELLITAADGHNLDGELHEFVECVRQPFQPDYKDALERLRASDPGPCTIPDCEWCAGE